MPVLITAFYKVRTISFYTFCYSNSQLVLWICLSFVQTHSVTQILALQKNTEQFWGTYPKLLQTQFWQFPSKLQSTLCTTYKILCNFLLEFSFKKTPKHRNKSIFLTGLTDLAKCTSVNPSSIICSKKS